MRKFNFPVLPRIVSLLLLRRNALPDQVRGLPDAPKQQRSRAQRQPFSPEIDQAFLVTADPVGKQTHLHVVDHPVSQEVVPTAIGDVGLLGLCFLLFGGAEQIVGGEPQAVTPVSPRPATPPLCRAKRCRSAVPSVHYISYIVEPEAYEAIYVT